MASCDKDGGDNKVDFDRSKMLQEISDQVISPSYSELKSGMDSLQAAFNTFKANIDAQSLQNLRTKFTEAYLLWQDCSVFEFGPAMDVSLRNSVNIFPTDTTKIINNISGGTYNLEAASNTDAKGFPALDFLLSAHDITTTVTAFQNADRMQYAEDVLTEMVTKITQVNTAWQNGYKTTFVQNNGTDAGSSLGLLVNQLNYEWELTKNPRIGIPLGKKSLGQALPEKTEGHYSGISVQLAVRNCKAIQRLYLGTNYTTGADASGLDEYVLATNAVHNGQLLHLAIRSQITAAITTLEAVPDPLAGVIINDPSTVDAAYIELQKTVVLLKTDMPSALGVLITYQDNDGD